MRAYHRTSSQHSISIIAPQHCCLACSIVSHIIVASHCISSSHDSIAAWSHAHHRMAVSPLWIVKCEHSTQSCLNVNAAHTLKHYTSTNFINFKKLISLRCSCSCWQQQWFHCQTHAFSCPNHRFRYNCFVCVKTCALRKRWFCCVFLIQLINLWKHWSRFHVLQPFVEASSTTLGPRSKSKWRGQTDGQ